jgi:hypothetical protein
MIMTDMQRDYWAETVYRTASNVPGAVFGNGPPDGPRTVRQAIEAAVDAIGDESITGLWPDEAPPFAQARAVLGSLTLCYARQIYHSAEAALVVARDLSFPCLFEGELPDERGLRRFRAENREAIHHCLTAALLFLVEEKISAGVVTKVNAAQVAEEANRRLIMAMFADSLEFDGERPRVDEPPA